LVLQLSKSEAEAFIKKVDFDKGQGFVPVVLQDASDNKVLMQAYMNEESLRLTLTKGKLHFWSRTRGRLWLKGEESGHFSLLENAILDCDNDAILFKVQQIGNICHTGKATCFHNPVITEKEKAVDAKIIERISEIILDRIKNPSEKSYVSTLTRQGTEAIIKKIDEEVAELKAAAKDDNRKDVTAEATDVLFHVMVLLAKKGVKIQDVFEELERRHQAKTQYEYSNKE